MDEKLKSQILAALATIQDPDLGRDIVSLGFVKNVAHCDGLVSFDIELTTPACPVKDLMQSQAVEAVKKVPGITNVQARMTAQVRPAGVHNLESLKSVKNLVAIASGKGGVGKSTVSVNLAVALARMGARVGLMDGDIYGPTIPKMLGVNQQPQVGPDQRMQPLEAHGIKFMSLGVLVGNDAPVIWRGPMASKMIQQLLGGVAWGDLDYLLIDLPPGTGDIQLTLTQAAPLTGAVIVTTPQDVAMNIAKKGLQMFRQVNVPVLGVIENMSHFACPHCGQENRVFGKGDAEHVSQQMGLPLLGRIPLDPALCESGDSGKPIVVSHPESAAAKAFVAAAQMVASRLSVASVEQSLAKSLPKQIEAGEKELKIEWDDGHASVHNIRKLRADCPCAICRDEWTGQRKIQLGDVPPDVKVSQALPVGRYALNLIFSDGHSTGLYGLAKLRESCECGTCVRVPEAVGA